MPFDPRVDSLRSEYPFESRFLDVGGVRLHYLDEGGGPPLVLLHGNPTWSFYYRDLVKTLRDTHRVIVPDHVGCGLSAKPRRYRYTLETHIRNVVTLIDHLKLPSVTIGGHDWGGAIACGWAVRNAERVRRMVVFNTAAFLGGPIPLRIRMCRWRLFGDVFVRGLNGFVRGTLSQATAKPERITPGIARGYLLPYDSWSQRVGVMGFLRDVPVSPRVPSHRVVREIEAKLPLLADKPMLILWGGRDFCFNDWYFDEWRRRFPAAEVHRFDDAGHLVVEDASERIIPLLRRFLDAGSPDPSKRPMVARR